MHEVVKINDKQIVAVEWNGERVITTAQLADVYGTDANNVQANFNRNKEGFLLGHHYIFLQGEDLKSFKRLLTDSQQPLMAELKFASQLYLRDIRQMKTVKATDHFAERRSLL